MTCGTALGGAARAKRAKLGVRSNRRSLPISQLWRDWRSPPMADDSCKVGKGVLPLLLSFSCSSGLHFF
jgi:hypothetical protein